MLKSFYWSEGGLEQENWLPCWGCGRIENPRLVQGYQLGCLTLQAKHTSYKVRIIRHLFIEKGWGAAQKSANSCPIAASRLRSLFETCFLDVNNHFCRPVVRGVADHSNFDDYSSLAPLTHEFQLSANEQFLFAGI